MTEAAWALAGVLVGAMTTGLINVLLQTRQFAHSREMFHLQNMARESVKTILTEMLNHRTHVERSFDALKAPIGGYADDEIRKYLHEVGAKRVTRKDNTEWWYLVSRNDERIAKRDSK